MKITSLMEDTVGTKGLPAEHGLSFYLETQKHTLLMDTGASDRTWENADTLGVDLSAVDTVIISHGHYDHAGGLPGFAKRNPHAEIYIQDSAFGNFYHGEKPIGMDRSVADLPHLHRLSGDCTIDDELSLFAGITGRRLWPSGNRDLTERIGELSVQDGFTHEQCLVVEENGRRILLSGCAHNGILNILDRFHDLYGAFPDAVLSGFHMMQKTAYTDGEIRGILETADALSGMPTVFYTGHCTGEAAFALMKTVLGDRLRPLHAGDTMEL